MPANKIEPPKWMKVWLAENARKTARFSATEYGAYMRLERDYWTAGPPDDDDDLLARITGLSVAEWRRVRPKIEPLFVVAGGQWVSLQIDADLEVAYALKQANASRTKAATSARQEKRRRHAQRNVVRDVERNVARHDNVDVVVHVHQDFKGANQPPQAKQEPVSVPVATDSGGDHTAGDSLPGWEDCHVY